MRIFSGIQPTGEKHLGNYIGAIRQWVDSQDDGEIFICIVDLHSITVAYDPEDLRESTLSLAALLLASGIDPERCTLFVQSHNHDHAEGAWLLASATSYGELRRMTQFKDKSEQQEFISVGLFTYPVLQAADILLYNVDAVPVGDDQRQHVELTRDVAERFNSRYGPTFTVPKAVIPKAGARVMDLQDPTRKMSKSEDSPQGTILILEDLSSVTKKIKRAVTSTEYDPASPGAANLFSILGAVTGENPDALAGRYSQYGPLKNDVADAVAGLLEPIQQRYRELSADPSTVAKILERGADKAQSVASVTLARARTNIGLLDR